MTVSLQFLGAARYVTGSKHLLIVNDKKVLIECGMVQGPREMASAHADYRELLSFTRHLAKNVFVVHGEERAALAYADHLRGAGFRGAEVPVHKQKFKIA